MSNDVYTLAFDLFYMSPVELDVIRAICAGRTVEGAAMFIGMSKHTAADHVKSVHKKMRVYDRASLALKAERAGLLVGVEV